MSYKLVIAEKPSVAQSIAKVIGADKREDGYLEGKQHCSGNSKSPELQWIISAGREKGRGTGCQNNGCVAGTEK